ncbi:16949_t:CDS:2, partial [Racocetra persica]
LSSEAKKRLCESLHQQYLNQKLAKYNEAKKLFIGLTDLNYKPGYRNHTYYKYLLSSDNKNDTALLEAYHPEEIYFQYIIRIGEKGFTLVEYPSEVYKILDSHEYSEKISREDLISKILIAYIDALSLIPE